ncbi:hypothetical protein [Flavobacterium oreochromis]|uniref:hypothetical protein n=1 Tax=Flavobacterium oreochromis TaxID=2906078 RepID=UPI00385D67B6
MKLIEEIKVDFKVDFEPTTIMINSGVYQEKPNYQEGDIYYLEDSYIPKEDWIIANKDDLSVLTENSKENKKHNKIQIGQIPERLKLLFSKIEIYNSKSKNEAFQKLAKNKEITLEIEEEINKYLKTFNIESDFKLYKLLVLYPNRKTTALVDFNDKLKFIGLHFDSSTEFEIESAGFSKNRFCLNLGLEDRELYFVNLSLNKIKELILEKNINEIVTLKTITPLFFKYFPNYPIVKLKIKPFEYYIAPTDNCIHEGTTLRKKEMDISITYIGYFNI